VQPWVSVYIDEAGAFVAQPAGQSLYSLVLAVVVPSSIETKLFGEFSGLLASWPHQEAEIKGSKLDESQAAKLVDLVSRCRARTDSNDGAWKSLWHGGSSSPARANGSRGAVSSHSGLTK
jgi:hypothetical protein